jgi:hypothetical protein
MFHIAMPAVIDEDEEALLPQFHMLHDKSEFRTGDETDIPQTRR